MKKIISFIKKAFHDVFLYKKRLILSSLGILIASLILNISIMSINFSTTNDNLDYIEYPKYTGCYSSSKYQVLDSILSTEKYKIYSGEVSNALVPSHKIKINLSGVDEYFLDYPIVNHNMNGCLTYTRLFEGEGITELDMLKGNRYILLEKAYCDIIFGDTYPIGQSVIVDDVTFIVKGVLETSPATRRLLDKNTSETEINIYGFAPRTALEKNYPSTELRGLTIFIYDSSIDLTKYFELNDYSSYERVMNLVEKSKQKKINDLYIVYFVTVVAMSVLELLIIIFNLKERNSEIGIKRAIGATKDDICFEFVLEQTIIGAIGLLIGVGVTLLISYIMSFMFYANNFYFTSFIGFNELLLSTGFLLAIIIFSSSIPVVYVSNINIVDVVKGE